MTADDRADLVLIRDTRFEFCVCGFPRWRHPANEADRTTIQPHHLFIEPSEPPAIVRFRRLPNGRFARLEQAG